MLFQDDEVNRKAFNSARNKNIIGAKRTRCTTASRFSIA
jgi:hypothetical protein